MRALAEQPPPPPKLTSIESDDDRIRAFVDGEYRQVVATVALVCGSVATAEDSVQEALARAWEHTARGKEIERLPAWITTVALNLARSQMRRWRSERRARTRARRAAPGDPRRHRRERRGVRHPPGAPRAPPPTTRGHRAALLPRSRRPRDRGASRDRGGNREGDAVPRAAVPRGDARRHPGRRAGARPCRFVRSSSSGRCARRHRMSAPSECSTASPTSARDAARCGDIEVGALARGAGRRAVDRGRARPRRRPGRARAPRPAGASITGAGAVTPKAGVARAPVPIALDPDQGYVRGPLVVSGSTLSLAAYDHDGDSFSFPPSRIVRLDSRTFREQGRTDLRAEILSIADGDGARWVVTRNPEPPNGLPDAFLKRIGADGAVVSKLLPFGSDPVGDVAVGAGCVWIPVRDGVLRYDAATTAVRRPRLALPAADRRAVAVVNGSVAGHRRQPGTDIRRNRLLGAGFVFGDAGGEVIGLTGVGDTLWTLSRRHRTEPARCSSASHRDRRSISPFASCPRRSRSLDGRVWVEGTVDGAPAAVLVDGTAIRADRRARQRSGRVVRLGERRHRARGVERDAAADRSQEIGNAFAHSGVGGTSKGVRHEVVPNLHARCGALRCSPRSVRRPHTRLLRAKACCTSGAGARSPRCRRTPAPCSSPRHPRSPRATGHACTRRSRRAPRPC